MSLRSLNLQQQISSFAFLSSLKILAWCRLATYGTDKMSVKLKFAILFADHHITCKLIFLCMRKLTIWYIVEKTFSPQFSFKYNVLKWVFVFEPITGFHFYPIERLEIIFFYKSSNICKNILSKNLESLFI